MIKNNYNSSRKYSKTWWTWTKDNVYIAYQKLNDSFFDLGPATTNSIDEIVLHEQNVDNLVFTNHILLVVYDNKKPKISSQNTTVSVNELIILQCPLKSKNHLKWTKVDENNVTEDYFDSKILAVFLF